MHVRLAMTIYDEQREREMRSISSLLIHGRVRKRQSQDTCLHVRLAMTIYDEQREREMRSISSLLIRGRVRKWMKEGMQ